MIKGDTVPGKKLSPVHKKLCLNTRTWKSGTQQSIGARATRNAINHAHFHISAHETMASLSTIEVIIVEKFKQRN